MQACPSALSPPPRAAVTASCTTLHRCSRATETLQNHTSDPEGTDSPALENVLPRALTRGTPEGQGTAQLKPAQTGVVNKC